MGYAIADRFPISQVFSERKDAADGRKAERDASRAASEEVKHRLFKLSLNPGTWQQFSFV